MARGGELDSLFGIGIAVGGSYLLYRLALDGQLGNDAQKAAKDIYHSLTGKDYTPGTGTIKEKIAGEASQAVWGSRYNWYQSANDPYDTGRVSSWGNFRAYAISQGWGDPGAITPSWTR